MVIPIYSRTQRLGWHTIRAFQQRIFRDINCQKTVKSVLHLELLPWLLSTRAFQIGDDYQKRHGKPLRIRYIRAVECETPTSSQIATAVTINRIFEVIPSHMTNMGERKYNR